MIFLQNLFAREEEQQLVIIIVHCDRVNSTSLNDLNEVAFVENTLFHPLLPTKVSEMIACLALKVFSTNLQHKADTWHREWILK